MECRKCPYFEKKRNAMHKGKLIVGLCRLRDKNISDETMSNELCKDRAVIDKGDVQKIYKEDSDEAFTRKAAFGGI